MIQMRVGNDDEIHVKCLYRKFVVEGCCFPQAMIVAPLTLGIEIATVYQPDGIVGFHNMQGA